MRFNLISDTLAGTNNRSTSNEEDRSEGMISLKDVWALIRRRLWLFLSIIAITTALAALVSWSVTKIYTATATLVLERKDVRPFETDAATQTFERDKSAAETEMDVLRSRQFGGRIVDKLNLTNDPLFNPFHEDAEPPRWNPLTALLQEIGLADAPRTRKKPVTPEIIRDRSISILLSQVNIGRTGESLAVNVSVSNPVPERAAEIANTIANMYVEASLEFKQDVRSADKQRARTTGGAVAFLRERVAQPLLITLRSEEARLSRERAEFTSRYGKNHPKIVDANSQIASVRKMIDDEVQRILQDLEIEALKPSARVVSLAETPNSPSYPRPEFIIPAALLGSALLALILSLLLESMDTTIREGSRASRILQLPNFGYIPSIVAPSKRRAVLDLSPSLLHESLRSVYLASRNAEQSKPLNIIMITACLQDSASAMTALGLAASAAEDGRKVVFADLALALSRPIASGFNSENGQKFLNHEITLADLISSAPRIQAGNSFTDASRELGDLCRVLNTKALRDIFNSMVRLGYDCVVLHAAPVLVVGDANFLAPIVDGVLLTVAWGQTTEEQLADASRQLKLNQGQIIGSVIDEVNPRIHAGHGYGGALKYYRETEKYMRDKVAVGTI
jgi:uncharacterized protein involved in exopolysaccharide biosynthesis/Mrp family chromosome partitioning ATPase